ncbi:MAG: GFA family protein [Rhizobiaceae bacterium]|nr:GFA family protein [Rhizobiaceae bacterium]
MTQTTGGGCLCGAVTFEVEGAFDAFFLCHCARCRKDTGSAHAANLFSGSATITWLTGKAFVKGYRLPGTRHERSFCSQCGSALPRTDDGMLVVPAGSLDDPVDVRPTAHISCAYRASWDHDLHEVPEMAGLPG